LSIEVVNLGDGMEEEFWRFVRRDPLDFRRFMSNRKHDRQDTDILLALSKGEIEGLMSVFKKSKVSMRGSREAIESLLDYLDLDEFELVAPEEHKDLILERYEPQICEKMYLMHINRGEDRILKEHKPVGLDAEDAEQIAKLMRESDPVWAQMTAEKVKETMNWSHWLGIRLEHKVVSIGKITFNEFGSVVGVVATDRENRNKGFATSVVSALVEEVFRRFDKALIFVLTNNHPAIHIYRRIGFKPYKTYLFAKI